MADKIRLILDEFEVNNMSKADEKIDSGNISVRGGRLEGTVVSAKTKNTAIVERAETKYYSKYRRYAKSRSRIPVHVPNGMKINVGDKVILGETRKISKTKSWMIIEIVGA